MKKIKVLLFLLFTALLFVIVFPHYSTRNGISVLGYHGVVSDEDKKERYANDRYTLSESQFERQIKYLSDHNFDIYTMEEIELYMQGKIEVSDKAVVLTFDDGYLNFNEIVQPILEKYGFHGSCFVIGKHLDDGNDKFLKHEDIISNDYVSYYSHSYNLHRKSKKGIDRKVIQDLSLDEIDYDFKKNELDSTYFAFPYGRSVEGIEVVLENNGVKLAFSYNQFRHVTRKDNPYYLPRYMIVDMTCDVYFRWIVE